MGPAVPIDPAPVDDPTDADFAMPPDAEGVIAPMTHEVDADDMFDPMAS